MSRPWQRWSAIRKRDVVLRLLRGEPVEDLAREVKVPVLELERWRRQFLEAGRAGLRVRQDRSEARGFRADRATILELTKKIELLELALAKALGPVRWEPDRGVACAPSSDSSVDDGRGGHELQAAAVGEWHRPNVRGSEEGGRNPRWAR